MQGPDETTTKAAAASLLSKLGITGSEQFDASSPTSTLTVAPQIGGLPTQGIETRVDVDAMGIRAATGRLVDPKADTDYPLQTATAAFKSLADRPMPMIAMYCGPTPVGAARSRCQRPEHEVPAQPQRFGRASPRGRAAEHQVPAEPRSLGVGDWAEREVPAQPRCLDVAEHRAGRVTAAGTGERSRPIVAVRSRAAGRVGVPVPDAGSRRR